MRYLKACLLLNLGLILAVAPSASAQSFAPVRAQWQTVGVGLSTPLGFNVGASYSARLTGPVFLQGTANLSKDTFVTKHAVNTVVASAGVYHNGNVALTSLSAGPAFVWGERGLDMPTAPGTTYYTAGLHLQAQLLFHHNRIGYEIFANINGVRHLAGLRLTYYVGSR